MPEAEIDDEVTSILTDIDLLDKADAIAEKLSGGQKRKLSVGKSGEGPFGQVSGTIWSGTVWVRYPYRLVRYRLVRYRLVRYRLVRYQLVRYPLVKYSLVSYQYRLVRDCLVRDRLWPGTV